MSQPALRLSLRKIKKTTHQTVRTVTGCLKKAGDSNEYKLTTAAGSTWEIKSDAVNLGEHVNHTVRVTGTVRNATAPGSGSMVG